MSWPAYSGYYNSGLPWIGSIPSHWRLVPNRAFLELQRRPVGSKSGSFSLLSLTLRGVILRDVSENKGKFPAAFDTYQEVDAGDLVFCLFDIEETPRTVGLSPHRGMITGAYDVFRVAPHANARYIEYLYLSLDQRKSLSYFYSGLRKVIRMPTFKGIRSPFPSQSEQNEIAAFLDSETAKIDALIDKQDQLIATLREDRAATITHAVTKGLNPNVAMKDSGAPWVGKVPAHWTLAKLKHGFSVTLGKMYQGEAKSPGDVELPHLKAGSVTENGLNLADPMMCWFTPAEARSLALRAGDVLVVEGGAIGRCAVLKEDVRGWGFQKSLNRVRALGNDSPRFLAYLIETATLSGHVSILCGKATIPHFTAEKLAELEWPHPSIDEQKKIVDFLDSRCASIDALINKSIEMIETLREYRSALITDAVTGKIDVREAV